jgi:hypothetical protein
MYYIRIYHDIAKTKDYNGTIDSPSMALSSSTSVLSAFFAPTRYRVVKVVHSCSDMVL